MSELMQNRGRALRLSMAVLWVILGAECTLLASSAYGRSLFDARCSTVRDLREQVLSLQRQLGESSSDGPAPAVKIRHPLLDRDHRQWLERLLQADAPSATREINRQIIEMWTDLQPFDFYGYFLLGRAHSQAAEVDTLPDLARTDHRALAVHWFELSIAHNPCFYPASTLLSRQLASNKDSGPALTYSILGQVTQERLGDATADPFGVRVGRRLRGNVELARKIRSEAYNGKLIRWRDPLKGLLSSTDDRGDYLLITLFRDVTRGKSPRQGAVSSRALAEALAVRALGDLMAHKLSQAEQRLKAALFIDFTFAPTHDLFALLLDHTGRAAEAEAHRRISGRLPGSAPMPTHDWRREP